MMNNDFFQRRLKFFYTLTKKWIPREQLWNYNAYIISKLPKRGCYTFFLFLIVFTLPQLLYFSFIFLTFTYFYSIYLNQVYISMITYLTKYLNRLIRFPPSIFYFSKSVSKRSSSLNIITSSLQNNSDRPQLSQSTLNLPNSINQLSWGQQLNVISSIQHLKPLLDEALSHSSTHLAMYLQTLNRFLTSASFQVHRSFFKEADVRVNSFSANLTLSADEFIQILRFRGTIRSLAGEISFLHNFGFEKKASILASTFIYKREFSFSQAVLVMRLLFPLGGVSLLLLSNFIKYFKEVAYGQNASVIKIEHLLSLLGLKFLKRNEMIIQNTLFDHVLHYMLQNMRNLIEGQTLTIKIDVLCTLICFDSRNNYRTDSDVKRYWVISLLKELQQSLDGGWVKELWSQPIEQPGLLSLEVIYILECINFARKNMLDFQSLDSAFTEFETKALQQFQQRLSQGYKKQMGQKNIEKVMRFIFNPSIFNLWINRKEIRQRFFQIILINNIISGQIVEPLVGLINSNPEDYESKLRLLQLGKVIITKQIQKGHILEALTLTFLQRVSPDIATSILSNIQQKDNEKIQLFLYFSRNCCSESISKGSPLIESTNQFIKQVYNLALISQSERGYEVAMSILDQHFEVISAALLSQDSSKANRSEMNALLSEEAYYISWIIFVNLSNGKSVSRQLKAFFDRLLNNDIVKFQLLSHSYEQPYPQTKNASRPTLTSPRTYDSLKFLFDFFNQDKYAYFIWDILLKRLSSQSASIRQQCFPLVEATFLRAYRKQKLRKVVMVTVLSSHIAGGVIVGARLKLQGLLQMAIDELVSSEQLIQYHYNCYLLLVSNALAADILSPLYFDKIMLHSLKKDPKMRHTCSLMLLYGASLRSRNEVGGVIDPQLINQQSNYLKFLIKNRYIALPRFTKPAPEKHSASGEKREVELTARLLAILFSFGIPEILAIESMVAAILEGPMQFGEWRCVANCYTPQNYSLQIKRQAMFRGRVNQLLISKLIQFSKMGLLSKTEETYFIDKFK